MRRIIKLSLAVLLAPTIALLSPQAKAQQATPTFQRTGFAIVGAAKRPNSWGPVTDAQPTGQATRTVEPPARQVSPSFIDLSDGHGSQPPPVVKIVVDPQLDARSRVIFPRAAYDADQEALRMQWIVEHEQRAVANDINRTKPLVYPAR
jgi:hypothetical protein